MKSNVVLESQDRNLFGVVIRQNTQGGFLSVSDLQDAYESVRYEYGWGERGINTIMQTLEFRERVYYVLKERGLINVGITTFMELIDNEGIAKVLKSFGVYKTTGRGENRQVMADPYVWVLLAMEMNPMIYAKVVIWLTDTLIFDRIEAGTEYLPMNRAISSIIPNPVYSFYAVEINMVIFGRHQRGIRDLASAAQLKAIARLESMIIDLIESGIIKKESDLLHIIRTHKPRLK